METGYGMAVMAKKKSLGEQRGRGRPKVSDRDDVTIKVDRKIASMVKAIAQRYGKGSAEILSELAQGPVERAYKKMLLDIPDEPSRGEL